MMVSERMMDYLGENWWAERIKNAIVTVLNERMVLTPDPVGSSSTTHRLQMS
jgi:isocitrate/isopropylmalate dehydrogenase